VVDQTGSQSTCSAVFNVILQSRFLGPERVEERAVILCTDSQDAYGGPNRYFCRMIGMLVPLRHFTFQYDLLKCFLIPPPQHRLRSAPEATE